MKDTSDFYGTFEKVFDGGDLYPFLRNHLQGGVVSGNNYVFRVKAKYQNGYTDYSAESLPVWACSTPSGLAPIRQTSVSKTHMSFEWSQPTYRGSCDLQGFALYMNDGMSGDVLTEIDTSQVRDKPFYTEHTTTVPNLLGNTYIF